MSIKQEEYSFYYKVKNESARKRLGFKAGFFWCTAKKQSLALSRGELAMDAAGFDEADFARPVRVHFPVENDIPPEGDMKEAEHTGLPLIYQLVTLIHIVLSGLI